MLRWLPEPGPGPRELPALRAPPLLRGPDDVPRLEGLPVRSSPPRAAPPRSLPGRPPPDPLERRAVPDRPSDELDLLGGRPLRAWSARPDDRPAEPPEGRPPDPALAPPDRDAPLVGRPPPERPAAPPEDRRGLEDGRESAAIGGRPYLARPSPPDSAGP